MLFLKNFSPLPGIRHTKLVFWLFDASAVELQHDVLQSMRLPQLAFPFASESASLLVSRGALSITALTDIRFR